MKNKPLLAAIALASLHCHSESLDIGDVVELEAGAIRGARDDTGVLSFKGVPYAAPPIGDRRWRAPQPVAAWSGVRDATQFGARCLSAWEDDPTPAPPQSEDCLTVNVWTAAAREDDALPVMVWIHGGGFQFGTSADPSTDGTRLAQRGVVVVSFNYRVGVLGFLAHPELDREGPSGNYGLQDQLAALRWVKTHIAKFGGDPGNVTVFGESAGAHAIGILLASPLAPGLMDRAIGQSGAFWDSEHGSLATLDEAHARGVAFAKRLGADSITALRAIPAETLNAQATWNFTQDPGITAFGPHVDGHVVLEVPAARYLRGEQLRIPLLAGWNDVEDLPFRSRALPHGTAQELRDAAQRTFGADRLPEFLVHYPADSDAQAQQSAAWLIGDLDISQQTWEWLELQRASGAPVFGYEFTFTSPYVPIASHLVDVPFVFGTMTPQLIVGGDAPPGDADRALSDTIMGYWVNFATRGDPNGPGLPPWPAYGDQGALQQLSARVEASPSPRAARFRFLSSFRHEGVLPAAWRVLPQEVSSSPE
jgi:para-nitrobenzyl esterase